MPTVSKLSPEEVAVLRSGDRSSPRQQVAQQFDQLLAGFAPGEWGDVMLDEGDSRVTVRNRLRAAAARRGFELEFMRSQADRMRFQVLATPDKAAPGSPAAASPYDEGGEAGDTAAALGVAEAPPPFYEPALPAAAPAPAPAEIAAPAQASPAAEPSLPPASRGRRRGRPRPEVLQSPTLPPSPAPRPASATPPPSIALPLPKAGRNTRARQRRIKDEGGDE